MTFLRIVIPLSVPTFPDHALPAPRNDGLKRRIQISNSEWICVRVLAARCARGLHQLHPPFRTEGAGKAGCRLHPRSCAQKAHEWTTGSTGSLRLSLREWFTAYFVLSPVTGFLATVALRMTDAARPRLGGHISAKLDASVGASGPHDFAVRDRLRQRSRRTSYHPPSFRRRWAAAPFVRAPVDRSRENPPCNPVCARHCRVHRIPPRVRDDSRSAPHPGETRGVTSLICPTG
jgi:hypothetical protein